MKGRLYAPAACALIAAVLAGCASTSSVSSSFKGEEHGVAQAIADLQTAATAGEEKKICALFTKANVAALGGQSGCEAAVKSQLGQLDSFELATKAVHLEGDDRATATVEAVVSGKKKDQTVKLVKEGGSWRIDELG
ncbi:MAG TPA: hypothetical protein VMA83_05895 [Solirubrobacteraceae bacterium]|nr:hypothetical protein [Solirubrobacteraceae bacterium]